MIPWFFISIIAILARLFGYQVHTLATVGRYGADRFYFVRPGEFGPEISLGPPLRRSNLRFKRVLRLDEIQRHFRLFRVMWERGTPGDGFGYSVKLAFGLWPRLFEKHRDAHTDLRVTMLGLRIHYCRSYGGRFA